MGNIKLDISGARSVIASMKVKRDNIEDYYGEMATVVASLTADGYMEGEAAEGYVTEFTDKMNPTIDEVLAVIDACITQIETLVNDIWEVEKNLFSNVFV